MIGAAEAPPDHRIEFRDAIARHKVDGVHAVEPWLLDARMRRFAVRVIVKAGELGVHVEAKTALRNALKRVLDEEASQEISWGLKSLCAGGAGLFEDSVPRVRASRSPSGELVRGTVYRRRELHSAGWGGNWQSGVSYPAEGDHVLLFSDPATAHYHGYKDRWLDNDRFLYFGAWSGTGDMVLAGVNQRILDRSPNLKLFLRDGRGWRFEGTFACIEVDQTRTERDGREFVALTFRLERTDGQRS